ncbi:MAG: hypothetical protein H7138_16965, partial [Myxococcales bacterium]|nr:hypothetical protein [Myxococcales bacterium]
MFGRRTCVVLLLLAAYAAPIAHAKPAPTDVVAQIDRLVRAHFYAPALLVERGWEQAVRDA